LPVTFHSILIHGELRLGPRRAVPDGLQSACPWPAPELPCLGAADCRAAPWPSGHNEGLRSPSCPCSLSRSEEHTSELQSRENLVCRLLLEKRNIIGHNS